MCGHHLGSALQLSCQRLRNSKIKFNFCSSPRGGGKPTTAITGSWAKASIASVPKSKLSQPQASNKKDTIRNSSGAGRIPCPICDEVCKDEVEFKAHVAKGHDDKGKQKSASEKDVIDIEKESGSTVLDFIHCDDSITYYFLSF